ncbi:erythromycin esterase family protein [Roseisolibacter agri]|uniref:Erythromycin esterase n=1 Tax=Roseisolibacter agri TaxID=2014610 RepID=A0AA37V1H3_9BACT|nr:erythromycin esterase family protein [Roseisolibacter agri]GLC23787.1 erythromycin esterase [Roseisolibacter agri]
MPPHPFRRRRVPAMLVATGALLLVGLTLVASAAGAQPAAPTTDSVEAQAAARVADAVCDRRVVLLGELPDHGHARGFGVKARIVERLVSRCGFRAVLFEAGSYDFFGLERAMAARAPTDSLELALARAIGGMWWTRELGGFRRWLVRQAVTGRVSVGGIDDQPIGMTAAYARATLPGLVGAAVPPARAAECRDVVARHVEWSYDATHRYDGPEHARLAECTRLAADRTPGPSRTPDEAMLDDLAGYAARERGEAPDRDLAMARNVAWWSARLPKDARIVVWTATVHAARSAGTPPVRPGGVPPMGERLAERMRDRMAVIGFTALRGQWARAGRPSQAMDAVPADALEARALARAAGDTAAWTYLDRARLRALGAAPSRLFGKVATGDWAAAFDGVLVLRDEAAPTFEPRR